MTVYPTVNIPRHRDGDRMITHYDARNGVNTPYHLRQLGLYGENSFSRNIVEKDEGICKTQFSSFPPSEAVVSGIQSYSFENLSYPLLADLISQIAEKWKGSSFNVGVTVMEGRESLSMIRNRLASIANAAYAIRRKNFSAAYRHLAGVSRSTRRSVSAAKDFSNAWLELQYGWLPLLNDIYEAADQIKFRPTSKRFHAFKREDGSVLPSGSYSDPSYITKKKNYKLRALTATVRNDPDFFDRWGLSDPASIAWELVPFSFVADWFVPIGSYLSAMHNVGNLRQSETSVTDVYERQIDVSVGSNYPVGPSRVVGGNFHSSIRYFQMTRLGEPDLRTMLENELPRALVPRFEPSIKRVISLAALVIQRLR